MATLAVKPYIEFKKQSYWARTSLDSIVYKTEDPFMSRKDRFHQTVRSALEKEGWTVTDPFPLTIGTLKLEIDLGAEKFIIAQKENKKIAVEVKSFLRGCLRIAEAVAYLAKYPRITLRNWAKSPVLGIRSLALANSQTSSESIKDY